MRRFTGYLLLLTVAALGWLLDNPITSAGLPSIGRLVDPVNGFWANAEPSRKDFNGSFQLPQLKENASVWFDDRLIPHIRAANDHDLYFLQGYLHAYFRLWQMDMETRATAGRISEVVGKKAIAYDRSQRRKGLGFAAEQSLAAMEQNPSTKMMLDAYTEGINAFSSKLNFRSYPLEYKLMGFKPEPWTNLKSALLLKYMADELTGKTDDISMTYLKSVLQPEILQRLYLGSIKGSATLIPQGTHFDPPSLKTPSIPMDAIKPLFSRMDFTEARQEGIGSNNWVVDGKHTQGGYPILCNDPHLGLHLPSLWYEAQLTAPGINVYGVSLPGAPGIIIGFNDSVCWGVTNNYRDVKDYYAIKRAPNDAARYVSDSLTLPFHPRIEVIKVKNGADFTDTVYYTHHGPVQYDERYPAPGGLKTPLAMCWMGHRGTNELLAVYLMNRAVGYGSFVDAIMHFECPAQSFLYTDRAGNIALWGQGQFVNKWKGQGVYIMDGSTKATEWGDLIPMRENPHSLNPENGFLFSANQRVTDSTYPYWYNGDFREFRAWRIKNVLDTLRLPNVYSLNDLFLDNYSVLAAKTLPIFLKHMDRPVRPIEQNLLDSMTTWNYRLEANSISASVYQMWWHFFYNKTWSRFSSVPELLYPTPERTVELLLDAENNRNSNQEFKSLDTLVRVSWRKAMDSFSRAARNGVEWYRVKHTTVAHLTNIPAFSVSNIQTGGWGNTVNAMKSDHGPSWRMMVKMGKNIRANCIYPGGQSGNPGSLHYDEFVKKWANGKLSPANFIPSDQHKKNESITYVWDISK